MPKKDFAKSCGVDLDIIHNVCVRFFDHYTKKGIANYYDHDIVNYLESESKLTPREKIACAVIITQHATRSQIHQKLADLDL